MATFTLSGRLRGLALREQRQRVVLEPRVRLDLLDLERPSSAGAQLGRWVGVDDLGALRLGFEEWVGPAVALEPNGTIRQVRWISGHEALVARGGSNVACWTGVDGTSADCVLLGGAWQDVLPVGEQFLLVSYVDQAFGKPPFGGGAVLIDRDGNVVFRSSTLESYGLCPTSDGRVLVFTLGMKTVEVLSANGKCLATHELPAELAYGRAPTAVNYEGRCFVIAGGREGGLVVWEVGTPHTTVVDHAIPNVPASYDGRYVEPGDGAVEIRRFVIVCA